MAFHCQHFCVGEKTEAHGRGAAGKPKVRFVNGVPPVMANGEHVAKASKGRRFSDKPKWPIGCSLCQCIVVSTVITDVCLIESKSSSFTLDQWLVCTSIH